ncbi:MAG: DUF6263 family protein [Pirellulales bacterium]
MANQVIGTLLAWAALACGAYAWADEAAATDTAPEGASDAGQKYDLRYKFAPGEVLRWEVVHRATVQTTIQGTSQTAETHSKSVKHWVIDQVADDGAITLTHSVESIDMWQKTQGRSEVRYNSQTDKEVPPGYETAAESVGVPLTVVTMNDRGKILKRVEKHSQPVSLMQLAITLPEQPVAIGESWSTPLDIDVVQKDGATKQIKTRQKFTLEKVSTDVATIKVDAQILTPIHDPTIEAQLIQRLSEGHLRFDIAAGRILDQQLDLDRHVINFSGPSSSMHYLTRFTEKALADEATVARKP